MTTNCQIIKASSSQLKNILVYSWCNCLLRDAKNIRKIKSELKASLAVKENIMIFLMFIKFTRCVFGEKSFALNKLSSCMLETLVNTKN